MTPADFRLAFPAFKDVTDAVITPQITASAPYFDIARWGAFLNEGVGNWVAHRIVEGGLDVVDGMSGTSNDITSKDDKAIKVSMSEKLLERQADDPYMTTSYGRRYRYLSRIAGMGGVVAGVCA